MYIVYSLYAFPVILITALDNQKRMKQGNTKRSVDFWSVKCNRHLNKRYHVVKKKRIMQN